ncbi:MAG: MBOAT family protein, partial [Planctomycetes bacterium]|nr:MBOAT family protein [Planctomycetota bacterium]
MADGQVGEAHKEAFFALQLTLADPSADWKSRTQLQATRRQYALLIEIGKATVLVDPSRSESHALLADYVEEHGRLNYTLSLHDTLAAVDRGLAVAGNLAALAFFKYFNFGVNTLDALLTGVGQPPLEVIEVLLPIGISFYVFQSISYVVDVYRGDSRPARSFVDFGAFVALFPQLIAGPILRYKDLADQFTARTHSFGMFSQGAARFMVGFCKKVLIADTLAPLAQYGFAQPQPGFLVAWSAALAYTGQLFFDFSGYSDMAIGLGQMMGFRFLENFDQPYISRSITEFWRRWHISLSNWLRDYLYVPLGGNRKGTSRTY